MPTRPSKMFYGNLTNSTILFQEEKDILLRSEIFVLTLSNWNVWQGFFNDFYLKICFVLKLSLQTRVKREQQKNLMESFERIIIVLSMVCDEKQWTSK